MSKQYIDDLAIGTLPNTLFMAGAQGSAIQDNTIEFEGDDADEPALEENKQEATEPSVQNLQMFLPIVRNKQR